VLLRIKDAHFNTLKKSYFKDKQVLKVLILISSRFPRKENMFLRVPGTKKIEKLIYFIFID